MSTAAWLHVGRDLERLAGVAPAALSERAGGAASVGGHHAAEHAVRHTGQALTTARIAGRQP